MSLGSLWEGFNVFLDSGRGCNSDGILSSSTSLRLDLAPTKCSRGVSELVALHPQADLEYLPEVVDLVMKMLIPRLHLIPGLILRGLVCSYLLRLQVILAACSVQVFLRLLHESYRCSLFHFPAVRWIALVLSPLPHPPSLLLG